MLRSKRDHLFSGVFFPSRIKDFAPEYPIATPQEFIVPCEKNSVSLKSSFHFCLFHRNAFLEGIRLR